MRVRRMVRGRDMSKGGEQECQLVRRRRGEKEGRNDCGR